MMGIDDVIAEMRSAMAVEAGKVFGVPMDLADGRPWVRTHDEVHDPAIWGDGFGGCGHAACNGGTAAGSQLTGLLDHPGVTR